MDAPMQEKEEEKRSRKKPSPQEVQKLQDAFPRLDALMCETLLMFTEEELAKYIEEE